MTYILLKKTFTSGSVQGYGVIMESNNLVAVEEKLKSHVKGGCPVDNLRIVQDIPFEFKCAIKLLDESDVNDP